MTALKKQWLVLVFGAYGCLLAMDPTATETERKIYARLAALQLEAKPSHSAQNASPVTKHGTIGNDLQRGARYKALPKPHGSCNSECNTNAKL